MRRRPRPPRTNLGGEWSYQLRWILLSAGAQIPDCAFAIGIGGLGDLSQRKFQPRAKHLAKDNDQEYSDDE
jgi:hypothetical protein